ncbi:DUF3883 domain-containing protein [Amphritea japonica]|uniref:Protein NO VEIN C-terminal domain-containing protein n=1 Tax=Amphritea japonica ATCC BAA-1530 TaxID=1278309 RepID=A0A7R6SRM7_9GAMM|nr:DUF3883 domain-containing protein [Amphritea japonica]BBB24945.1 conserved hypothetical protein [Amphritea japonica ATCC BAA-1530]
MANNWSESEVEAVVQDYFNMLRLELRGEKYNKTGHRRALIEQLNNRTHGSIEMKHQNISAVLMSEDIQGIIGYKPLGNYQGALFNEVFGYLARNRDLYALFKKDAEALPIIPSIQDFLAAYEDAPEPVDTSGSSIAEPRAIYVPEKVNFLEIEANNIELGDAGEQFVINFEKARLIRAGKESLAERIEQISVTQGPAAGFDILSFEENGTDRYIEAKTTKNGKNTPFYVTPNELRFSQANAKRYHLYRVFKYRTDPKVFSLQGNLEELCDLRPSEYMGRVG